ncbi:MAG TPA: filamentous hemagglutinin N-terminal domain-containing protein, partial [Rhizomicrobium sp.]|nr:filamentous hemagglutinin N-terminal domain-containing protein [Rhizomicrobium sp.]
MLAIPLPAYAQPSGGSVAFGQATIAAPNANSTVINQSTQSAIINWQGFSIDAGASVQFNQPNAAAITLNRVLGGSISQINGALTANGQVWIINQNGILFGKGSQVNVSGLLATTSDIADADFAAGNYNFSSGSPNAAASIDNAGSIHVANGGSAVLSASHVGNTGLIQADAGQIVLGGASAFTIDFDGDNLLRYAITTPVSTTPTDANGNAQKALVENGGTLTAAGGKILMTARAAANVADNVVNNTGMVSATSASIQNGEVVLDAGDGSVQAGGTISATGNGAGQTGGNITLAGANVTVADNAVVDASGDQGGGTIAIGGGLHGTGSYAPAQNTSVGNATIRADANTSGNGGTISIWSTGQTNFSGSASANGGAASGNGGTIETSGQYLSVAPTAKVTTTAANGASGDWLLDPSSLSIVSS